MVWGIFPETVKKGVSWEAHLSGALTGLFASLIFIKHGPQRKKYEWDEDDDINNDFHSNDDDYIYHIVDE